MAFSATESHDVKMARIIDLKFVCIPVVIAFLLLFLWGPCHGQNVRFNVFNQRFDYAVFIGERDIVLRCCVDGFESGIIQIELPEGDVFTTNGRRNYVEYKINQVQISDGGEYKCVANYDSVDGKHVSEKLRLYLNVPVNDSTPTCVRSGTYGEPYGPDDWLLLSCYCRSGVQCRWSSTVPGSGSGTPLHTNNTYIHNGIRVLQVLVSLGTDSNLPTGARYDCTYSTSFGQRCSIGPASVSSNDIIVNTATMESYRCPLETRTSTVIALTTTIKQNSESGDRHVKTADPNQPMVFSGAIIIILIIVAIIVAVAVVILVIVGRRRGFDRRNDDNKTASFNNQAFPADNERNKPPYESKPDTSSATVRGSTSNSEVTGNLETSHTYEHSLATVCIHTGMQNMPKVAIGDYAEIEDSGIRRGAQH